MAVARMNLIMAVIACIFMAVLYARPAVVHAQTSSQQRTQALIFSLKKEQFKSKSVINFWNNKGRWALYTHRDKCWQIVDLGGRRVCKMARYSLRLHTQRLRAVRIRLVRLSQPGWCSDLQGNRSIGCKMAHKFWPSASEWNALEELWTNESGWSERANNPTSSACGIPQAMNNCAFGYNPSVQIAWGLRYIKSRYGSPSSALSKFYSRSPHWY